MTVVLLRILGALGCILATNADVMPQKDFSLQAISGKWYLIGFATNAQWFRKADMKMGTALLMPTAEGDLDIFYSSLKSDGSCWKMTDLAKRTDIPGKFTIHSQRRGKDNDMRVVDVKYDEYALVHIINTKAEVSTVLNKLYARRKHLSPEALQKFTELSLETGILPENIAILPKNDECPVA